MGTPLTNFYTMVNLNDDQSTTTPSDKFTDPVTIHLMQIRRKLIDRHAPAFYLGDPARNFKHQVVWKQVGNDKQLVASAVEQMEETQLAVLTSEPSAGLTSIVPIDPLVEPVLLSTIVFIDFDNCWFTPCGFWKGRTNATEKFEDIKLSFQGKAPPKEFLSQDFLTFIKNTKMLMDDASLGGQILVAFWLPQKKEKTPFNYNIFFLRFISFFFTKCFLTKPLYRKSTPHPTMNQRPLLTGMVYFHLIKL